MVVGNYTWNPKKISAIEHNIIQTCQDESYFMKKTGTFILKL